MFSHTSQLKLSSGRHLNDAKLWERSFRKVNILWILRNRGCQIGTKGPKLCAKPRHFCKLDVATSRMAFLDLNLHALQLDNSISNNCNWGCSVVQNCTSDTPYWGYLKFMTPFPGITKSIWLSKYGRYAVCTLHNTFL